METNHTFDWRCCQSRVGWGGMGSSQVVESSGNCQNEECLQVLRMVPRKRDDHKGRDSFSKALRPSYYLVCVSVCVFPSLREINVRYSFLSVSSRLTVSPPLPLAPHSTVAREAGSRKPYLFLTTRPSCWQPMGRGMAGCWRPGQPDCLSGEYEICPEAQSVCVSRELNLWCGNLGPVSSRWPSWQWSS